MKFEDLASYLEKLEKTSSRIEITKVLARLFGEASREEIDKIVYLSLGILAPSYRGVILNIAEKMMVRILAKAYGREASEVIKIYKQKGDLGNTAESLSLSSSLIQKNGFSVTQIFAELIKVAEACGAGSQERKIEILAKLLQNLDPLSAKFVSRIPVGRLRLGFSDKTILDALSWMERGDKSLKSALEKAYRVLPDVGLLAKKVREGGIVKAVREVKPIVGVPVLPMLAQRIKSPTEMIAKMGRVAIEPKLDGLRLLIHYQKPDLLNAYTRNLNETSWMFPELKGIGNHLSCREAILDCEAVGLDEKTKLMADFQTTMTRRRKHNIEDATKKVGIEFFVFDILVKDGQSLMDETYTTRRKALESTLKPGKIFKLVDYELTEDPQRIIEQYQKKVKEGLEGVIVKRADGKYVPGRTGWRWVKMKQVEKAESKLADTIDAVVMGYTPGKGKRASFGVGQFLVGIKDGEKFKTTSKIGTGLTDAQFRELNQKLKNLRTKERPKEYDIHKQSLGKPGFPKNLTPDFWVIPSLVVEIAADEITKSPTHTAGLALRFPRLINFRDDKSPNEITTLRELKRLFEMQKR